MQTVQPSLFARDDTFLGVCLGLGEDFGFDPLYLRLALTLLLFFYPAPTMAGYLAAGLLVLVTRLLIPNPRPAAEQPAAERAPVAADDKADSHQLPLAA